MLVRSPSVTRLPREERRECPDGTEWDAKKRRAEREKISREKERTERRAREKEKTSTRMREKDRREAAVGDEGEVGRR